MTPACFAALTQLMLSAVCADAATVMPVWTNDNVANTISFNDTFGHTVIIGTYSPSTGTWTSTGLAGGFTNLTVSGSSTLLGILAVTGAVSGAGMDAYTATRIAAGLPGMFSTLAASGLTGLTGGLNVSGGALTSSGLTTLSGALNVSGASGAQPTAKFTDTGGATLPATGAFYFLESEAYASFGSTNTHMGLVVQATKNVSGANSTGSRQASTFQQLGAGGTSADFFTAGFELTEPCLAPVTCNGFNLSGNFTGNNPYVYIPAAMTPTTVVGEEVDVTDLSAGATEREGLRVVDISSTQHGTIDAAMNIVNGAGVGFNTGLYFGDGTSTFGITAGGTFLDTPATTVALSSLMNFANVTGVPTLGGIVLSANTGQTIGWGTHTACCAGGQFVSNTTSGGPSFIFGNGFAAYQVPQGTNSVLIEAKGQIYQVPQTIANVLAVTCNGASEGSRMYVKDSVGSAAATFHLIVASGGVATIDSPAYCDGTNWRYE
jgi:hypothetical protein